MMAKELEVYTLTMVREIADKAHAAGRRAAWEKMWGTCVHLWWEEETREHQCSHASPKDMPCTYDTCPLLKDKDGDTP